MKKLTAATVESAPAAGDRYELSDGGTPLRLVVFPSGQKSWAVRFRVAGRTRKLTLGKYPALSLKDARVMAGEALTGVAKGADPAAEKRETRERQQDTVRAVVADYIERWQKPRNRTWQEVDRLLDRLLVQKFGSQDIRSIERRTLVRVLRDSNRKAVANVKKFFAWCVEQDLIDASPASALRSADPIVARDRVLTDDELRAFLKAIDRLGERRPSPKGTARKTTMSDLTIWPSFLELLTLTAARRDEVAAAPWSEFDLEAGTWTLHALRSKNGKAHVTALAPRALEILRLRRQIVPDRVAYVFPAERGGTGHLSGFSHMKPRLDGSMREDVPDLPEWRLHDLRRTAATRMAALGHPIHVVERVLNHVSGSTTGGLIAVYQRHDFATERAAALADWASFLQGLRS